MTNSNITSLQSILAATWRLYSCIYLQLYARTPAQHSLRVVPRVVHISRDANPRRGGSHPGTPLRLCTWRLFSRPRAIPRENAPVPTPVWQLVHGTRVISDAGALPHVRNARSRLLQRLPNALRCVSRDARTTKSTGTVQQHGMVRAKRNAHRERAACLPRESHNQLCATIAMGRLGSEQACLPRATEFARDLPRSTYEGTQRWSWSSVHDQEIERPRTNETGIEFKIHWRRYHPSVESPNNALTQYFHCLRLDSIYDDRKDRLMKKFNTSLRYFYTLQKNF